MRWLLRALERALDQSDPQRIAARIQADADQRARAKAYDAWELHTLQRELETRWASDGDLRTLIAQAERLPDRRTEEET